MSVGPIKFRCFKCGKLLGVSTSRAGTVVVCPKCATELLVPDPAEPAVSNTAPAAPAPQPTEDDAAKLLRELVNPGPRAEFVAADPAEIRAETVKTPPFGIKLPQPSTEPPADFPVQLDTGVASANVASSAQPGFPGVQIEPVSLRPEPRRPRPSALTNPWPTTTDPSPPPAVEGGFPSIQVEPPSLRPEPRRARPPAATPPNSPPPLTTAAASAPAINVDAPENAPDVPETRSSRVAAQLVSPGAPLVTVESPVTGAPPVRIEPPSALTSREPAARRNDVVLPRTAVVLWSFCALIALVFAFTAGVLAGHFIWSSESRFTIGPSRTFTPAPVPSPR